jgi:hypothetical protein
MPELLWVWDYVCSTTTVLERALVLQEFEAPRLFGQGHMEVVRMSALLTVAFIPK